MSRHVDTRNSEFERVLAGHEAPSDASVDIARFLRALDGALSGRSAEELEAAHLAAMTAAVVTPAEKGDPVARPASKAHGSGRQTSGLPKPRRIPMFKELLKAKWARVAALTAAALLLVGGTAFAATTGSLPPRIQKVAAAAVAPIGISLPAASIETTPSRDTADTTDTPEPPDQASATEHSSDTSATEADQGENADVQDELDHGDAIEEAQHASEQNAQQADEQNAQQADSGDEGGSTSTHQTASTFTQHHTESYRTSTSYSSGSGDHESAGGASQSSGSGDGEGGGD